MFSRFLMRRSFDLSLYLIANRPSFKSDQLFLAKIQEAVRGGVTCVQYRDHERSFKATLLTAFHLKRMLGETPLIINTRDSVTLAIAVEAAGLFCEQGKLSGGKPVKTLQDANIIADYLSVKVFPSETTNPGDKTIWGLNGLAKVRALSPYRIIAIGGINEGNAQAVSKILRPGDGIAIASKLLGDDPFATAQKIRRLCEF